MSKVLGFLSVLISSCFSLPVLQNMSPSHPKGAIKIIGGTVIFFVKQMVSNSLNTSVPYFTGVF